MKETRVFCPACREHHRAEVRIEDGFPITTWIDDEHDLRRHLDAIAEDGGKALALVLDAGDWDRAEDVLSAVLELNDPKPEEDRS